MSQNSLTRTELCELTGAKAYQVNYLKECGRLPIFRKSAGKGYPTLFEPSAIQVVKEHLARRYND